MLYKKKFRELIKKLSNEDKKIIENTVNEFSQYVDAVHNMENSANLARFRMDTKDYQEYISRLDRNRRALHDSVIVGVRLINRMCKLYELPVIFEGDTDCRVQVGDFIFAVVKEYFEERN